MKTFPLLIRYNVRTDLNAVTPKQKGADKIKQQEYFEYLIDHYQDLIYSICYKSVGNPFDAEDVTQEVFLSAYKKLSDFDRTYEKAWLCKIAVHKNLDFLKRAGRRSVPTDRTFFGELPGNDAGPEKEYLLLESKQYVYNLCTKLKNPYKEISLLHFYHELSVPEIAAKTGKNVKTIQTQLYRAKAMLKKYLERSR